MTRIILSKKSAPASEPTGDAMWGMIIMIILLLIVAFFFCILPVYRLIKKRMNYWDQIENDPRWNIDHFQFSPSHAATQTRTYRVPADIAIKMPPAYSDLFINNTVGYESSLGDPPSYYFATHGEDTVNTENGKDIYEDTSGEEGGEK